MKYCRLEWTRNSNFAERGKKQKRNRHSLIENQKKIFSVSNHALFSPRLLCNLTTVRSTSEFSLRQQQKQKKLPHHVRIAYCFVLVNKKKKSPPRQKKSQHTKQERDLLKIAETIFFFLFEIFFSPTYKKKHSIVRFL